MNLGNFYKQTEKLIINDIITYLVKSENVSSIKILNISTADSAHLNETRSIFDMKINENPTDFLKNINEYRKSLRGQKFDIVNCRFVARIFMMNMRDFIEFIGFISDTMKPGGIFMGFLLDVNKMNEIFTDTTEIRGGPYELSYINQHDDDDIYSLKQVNVNGEVMGIINFSTLETICRKFGMIHIDNIILESLHRNSLSRIVLTDYEKQFGFLNYVFLFRKM